MHFFLNWGKNTPDTEKNKMFFQAICTQGKRVLIFPFSEGTEKPILFDDTAERNFFEKWRDIIARYNLDKQLQFECARRDIPTLVEQIKNTDILFFCWGKTYKHLEVIDAIPDLKELLQDKIIVWCSAGALMWSKAYYSLRADKIYEGNGWLPIKLIVHRRSDSYPGLPDEEREKILDKYWEKLPIYKIPEQEYIEFEI